MPFDGIAVSANKSNQGQLNFAPVKPLSALSRKKDKAYQESSLANLIRELHQEITNKDLQARREIAEVGRLMANLRSGKQIMKRDPVMGGFALFAPLPQKPRSDRHVVPLAQVNSSQLTSIWTLSRPRVLPRHFGNTNRAQIQHALLEKIIEHYDAEIFDELFHQQESLSMMDYGTAIIRVFYDRDRNQLTQLLPVIRNERRVLFEGYGYCPKCGFEGKGEDFANINPQLAEMPQCPECETFVSSHLAPSIESDVAEIVGVEEIRQGDLNGELLAIPACNWDMRVLPHQSSYFHYRSTVPLRLVESILGIEVAAQSPDSDFGLNVLNSLGTRGGSVEGLGRDNLYGNPSTMANTAIMDEEWFEPEWYAGSTLPKDEETLSGEVIPARVPLEKIFPQGMCAVGFNEMTVLAGVYNEKRRISGGVYHIQSHSGVGKGTSDAIETSEQLNMSHTAALEQIKRFGAGGGVYYDKNVLTQKEARQLLKPGGLLGVDLSAGGKNYTSIDQAIKQIQHNEVSQSNLAVVAQLSNLLNICFQTTEFTSGVADQRVDVNTARGQEMLAAQNQQRSAAPLRMKGYTRTLVSQDVLEIFREYIQIPKFFGTSDKFALTKGRFISGADLPEHIKCDFVPDSEIPTNKFTKRHNTEQMLEKSQHFGLSFVELMQVNPRIAAWWADQFGATDIPLFNQQEILIVCQERMDQLADICADTEARAAQSGYYADLNATAQECVGSLKRKVFLSEENHQLKAQVISEYLDDDEVESWSELRRASVEALINLHLRLDRDKRFQNQALEQEGAINLQMQAAGAQMMTQAAGAQLQQQFQAPQMEQQRQQALEEEAQMRAADEEAEKQHFAREQMGKELDHERALELQKLQEKQNGNQKSKQSR